MILWLCGIVLVFIKIAKLKQINLLEISDGKHFYFAETLTANSIIGKVARAETVMPNRARIQPLQFMERNCSFYCLWLNKHVRGFVKLKSYSDLNMDKSVNSIWKAAFWTLNEIIKIAGQILSSKEREEKSANPIFYCWWKTFEI